LTELDPAAVDIDGDVLDGQPFPRRNRDAKNRGREAVLESEGIQSGRVYVEYRSRSLRQARIAASSMRTLDGSGTPDALMATDSVR
jgi:hypothetical protein